MDVDSVASHLEGYGFERPTDSGDAYTRAIPRAIELLGLLELRCTFFLIADEARRHPDVVASIVSAGHEIASHSMTHPLNLADLEPAARAREFGESRELLEDLSGRSVIGFRAPGWGLPAPLLQELAAAGYRYDASAFPSPVLLLLRRSVATRSGRSVNRPRQRGSLEFAGSPAPRLVPTPMGSVWEFPIATTPVLRLPYYHTLRYLAPASLFSALESAALLRRSPVSYVFHAVDFLGIEEDGLDDRIRRHPGMTLSLDEKLALNETAIRVINERRATRTIERVVEELESARRG